MARLTGAVAAEVCGCLLAALGPGSKVRTESEGGL